MFSLLFPSLAFLKLMLKFSVQTFYQPLFSNSFAFSNLPPALSLQQFISLPKPPISKASLQPKAKSQKPPFTQKAKSLMSSSSEYKRLTGKQGGAAVLGEGRDTVRREPAFLLL
jgi:hypothetical protein